MYCDLDLWRWPLTLTYIWSMSPGQLAEMAVYGMAELYIVIYAIDSPLTFNVDLALWPWHLTLTYILFYFLGQLAGNSCIHCDIFHYEMFDLDLWPWSIFFHDSWQEIAVYGEGDAYIMIYSIMNCLTLTFDLDLDLYFSRTAGRKLQYMVRQTRTLCYIPIWYVWPWPIFNLFLQDSWQEVAVYGEADAYIVIYSVADRETFDDAVDVLHEIRKETEKDKTSLILVANKQDMVRLRDVSSEGKHYYTSCLWRVRCNNLTSCVCLCVSQPVCHETDSLLPCLLGRQHCNIIYLTAIVSPILLHRNDTDCQNNGGC